MFTLLYGVGCAPGLLWQDSGLIQYRVYTGDTEGFFGLALSHPLYYWLATAIKTIVPISFPRSVNLISALCGALTVANVFLLLRLWTGAALPGYVAALCLGLSHTFWRHACIAETYCFWSFLFTTELLLFLVYQRTRQNLVGYALAFVSGMALAVHMLALLPFLVYLFYVGMGLKRRQIKWQQIGILSGFWIFGSLPYLWLIVTTMLDSGDVIGTLGSAAFGDRWYASVLNSHLTRKMVLENLLYIGLNFPTPLILLAPLGLWNLWKCKADQAFSWLLMVLGGLFLVFAFRYKVPDRYAFFIPFYVIVSVMIGWGTHGILCLRSQRWRAVQLVLICLFPVAVYAALPNCLTKAGINIGTRGDVPYRDDLTYFLVPWKTGYHGAEYFAHEALEQVPEEALIFTDLTGAGPLLLCQQLEPLRSDVMVISSVAHTPNAPQFSESTIDALVAKRPVYVVSPKAGYCPDFIRGKYRLEQDGVLWRVIPN